MEEPDTTSPKEEVLDIEEDVNGIENGSENEENDESGHVSVGAEESEEKSIQTFESPSSEEQTPVESDNAAKETMENGNANESNTANSSMTSDSSLEKSEGDSSDENDCADDSPKIQTLIFSPSWSESLKSRKDVLGFSPSESGSGHGMGKETHYFCGIHLCCWLDLLTDNSCAFYHLNFSFG